MYEGQRIQVLGNFFRITFIENPGMAFGFDPGVNFKLWISIFSIGQHWFNRVHLSYKKTKHGVKASIGVYTGWCNR